MVQTWCTVLSLLIVFLSPTRCQAKHQHHNASLEPDDLKDNYFNIFKSGNRNAASHLWTSFMMQRAASLPEKKVLQAFKYFCAVSGSLLPDDPRTIYKVTLPRVTGGKVSGAVRHCCWPCICDMHDLVRVDTKTMETADGKKKYDFLVIGDPCKNATALDAPFKDPFSGETAPLSRAASEVKCHDGKLVGAVYSDHGYPIIGLLFDSKDDMDAADKRLSKEQRDSNDPTFGFGGMCVMRQLHGYNSGMGLIFHLVADITPIPDTAPVPYPNIPTELENELIQKAALEPEMVRSSEEFVSSRPVMTAAWKLSVVAGVAGAGVVAFLSVRWYRGSRVGVPASTTGRDSETPESESAVE